MNSYSNLFTSLRDPREFQLFQALMVNCSRTLPFYCRDFTRGVPTVTSPGQHNADENEEIDVEEVDEVEESGSSAAERLTSQEETSNQNEQSTSQEKPVTTMETNADGASRKREGNEDGDTSAPPPKK